jgi:hypothetical protein
MPEFNGVERSKGHLMQDDYSDGARSHKMATAVLEKISPAEVKRP